MFIDRVDAAEQLAKKLEKYANNPDAVIIAIPRGGLELGAVLAQKLHLPLDVLFSKKIGYPGNPEFAIGAITQDDVIIDPLFANRPDMQEYIAAETKRIRQLLHERRQKYRGDQKPLDVKNKIVIVTDDGIATGNTMLLTLKALKKLQPKKLIVALPVGPPERVAHLKKIADEVHCLLTPEHFFGVGQAYRHFGQVEDADAIRLLQASKR